jgi:putative Mn2+ efflux pump MntP
VVKAKEEVKNGPIIGNRLGTTISKKEDIIAALVVIVFVQLIVIFKY